MIRTCSLIACLVAFIAALGPAAAKECESKTYPINSTLDPVTFTTPLSSLRWLGGERNADKYVFALTGGKGFEAGGEIYRSDDFGCQASWRNISADLEGLLEPPAAVANHSYLRFLRGAIEIHHSFRAAQKILVQGVGHHNWISDDFGTLWDKVDSPGRSLGYWTQIKMHPNKTEWLLAMTKRHICWETEIDQELDRNCASDLFASQDFGRSWTNLTEGSQGRIASFVDFDWGALLNPWWGADAQDAEDQTIFATVYEDAKHMKGPLPGWDHNIHYVMSHDFFKTSHEKVVSCGNLFDIKSQKVYLAVPSNCPYHPDGSKRKLSAQEAVSSSVIMYISEDRGITFKEACIPMGDLDLGYELRSEFFGVGTTLIADHAQQDILTGKAPVANIYSSGGESGLFSLIYQRAFKRGRHTDFVSVEGVPGMYIANTLSPNTFAEAAMKWDAEDTDYEKYLITTVSHNAGSEWHLLKQPETFNYPTCDSCSKLDERWQCQLHLHGPTSWRSSAGSKPALHSHASAPGVVIATGNTGEFLDTSSDVSCTWLSRDGGQSWQDIADYAHVFEFGDHGGIIVMARHQTQGPAYFIQFSLDQGQCWHRVNLTEPIDVIDIRVEPTAASQVFLVYGKECERTEWHSKCGHTEEGTRAKGKLYAIDIPTLGGGDFPTCGNNDYEKFSVPSNDETCLLGRKITVTRRKPDVECFNGRGWDRPEGLHEFCDCTKEDVECEFGYRRSWVGGECLPIGGFNVDSCPAVSSGKYVISDTHLRLLGGDACKNISSLIPDTDGRGHSTLPHRHAWLKKWGITIAAVLAGVAVLAVIVQAVRGGGFDGGALLAAPAAAVGGAVDWIRSKVTGQQRPEDGYSQPLSGDIEDFDVDEEDDRS